MAIINRDRSVIPACDVKIDVFQELVPATAEVEGIGGYKVGLGLAGRPGYDRIVEIVRSHTDKPIVFDPQKWGTDIPFTANAMLEPVKESGMDAVILFPQSGPVTEYEWIKTAQDLGLGVIVGGEMTHPGYNADGKPLVVKNKQGEVVKDYDEIFRSLGITRKLTGFIREGAPEDMYELAARMGVTDFVVPGNKTDRIEVYKALVIDCGLDEPIFYSPGLVAQGGNISEGAIAAGKRFHGIVGRGIYNADDFTTAAKDLTSKL